MFLLSVIVSIAFTLVVCKMLGDYWGLVSCLAIIAVAFYAYRKAMGL